MNFDYTPKVQDLRKQVIALHERACLSERAQVARARAKRASRWEPVPIIEELKPKARAAGLWNLLLPKSHGGTLTNLDYAPLCEMMGRVTWAPRGLQLLGARHRQHGDAASATARDAQKQQWLRAAARRQDPLGVPDDRAGRRLVGRHQHPDAASGATATTTSSTARKWWSSRRRRSALRDLHRHGQDRSRRRRAHSQQSMVLVPRDTPGVKVLRPLTVFGYDDAPHGHMEIELEERARAGRQHAARRRPRLRDRAGAPRAGAHPPLHAARSAQAERALEMMCKRAAAARRLRPAAGRAGASAHERIAEARMHDRLRRGCWC